MTSNEDPALRYIRMYHEGMEKLEKSYQDRRARGMYLARSSAFLWAIIGIGVPVLVFILFDRNVFDGDFGTYLDENRGAGLLFVAFFTASWKGAHWWAVKRHDPKRKEKTDD